VLLVPYASSPGADVFYSDTGGSGPALVLAHGFLMDSSMFRPQIDALGDQVRIVAWDARGHGQTTDSGRPFTYWDLALDALAVMDAAGVGHAFVGGMSQGGFSALRMALTAPARVDGLVLIGTTAAACAPGDAAGYRALFDAWFSEAPLAPVAEGLAGQLIGGTAADRAPWIAGWLASDRRRIAVASDCLIARDDVTERLGQITCPSLVIRGGQDQAFDRAAADALCAGLPAAHELIEVPGAGHAVTWTDPDPANAAIAAFVR
jgi:pimeloyl-ACP methyl ester carboxylesterase